MTQKIKDETKSRFIIIPNIVDEMQLSPYAFRLYVHYKRVAGETGECWKSVRTLADACKMSTGAVTKARKELSEAHLIKVEEVKNPSGGKRFLLVTVVDIWHENKATSRGELASAPSERPSAYGERSSAPGEIKNIPLRRFKEEDIDDDLLDETGDEPIGDLASLEIAFTNAAKLPILSGGEMRSVQAYRTMKNAGVTPDDIARAVMILQDKKYRITGASSIVNTAVSLAGERLRNETQAANVPQGENWFYG